MARRRQIAGVIALCSEEACMSRKATRRQPPLSMFGQVLLNLADACRDIRVITRAG